MARGRGLPPPPLRAENKKGDHVEFTGEFAAINDVEMSGGSTMSWPMVKCHPQAPRPVVIEEKRVDTTQTPRHPIPQDGTPAYPRTLVGRLRGLRPGRQRIGETPGERPHPDGPETARST